MWLSIRKLLSRKFYIVLMKLAGLLTCVLPLTFPSLISQGIWLLALTVVFEEMIAADTDCSVPVHSAELTVAGTVPEFLISSYEIHSTEPDHRIPF
jgi:hypothetical protein